MQDKKESALAVTMAPRETIDFEVSEDFALEAQKYHRKQEAEKEKTPVVRHKRKTAVERANDRERDANAAHREAMADAEKRWQELSE